MLIRKGFVNQNKMWEFCRNYEDKLQFETWNNKQSSSGRKCLWFGLGVHLGFNSSFFKGAEIPGGLRLRCDQLYGGKDWNSLLLYKYESGHELKPHIDKSIFDSKVVLINVCQDNLLGEMTEFSYGGETEILKDGEIVEFDNKIIHGVKKLKAERFSLSIRKII